MQARATLVALSVAAMLLAACDNKPSDPPVPAVEGGKVDTGNALPTAGRDASVPPADSVIDPASSPEGTTAIRENAPMTEAEEAASMPMAGQANAHSAPDPAQKPASAP